MLNLISRAINYIGSWLTQRSAETVLPILCVGILLLTTNVDRSPSEQRLGKTVDQDIHQTNEKRPKTTGEWNQQSRETQGKPGERLKRIGEQSVEAAKDFGSVFPDTAKRSAADLKNGRK
jgi:broad specificity phosphatase PhoE